MFVLDRSTCGDTRAALAAEWIAPNGLGGYAALTVAGACTRRDHGLLVVDLDPPGVQTVLVAGVEECLIIEGARYDLSRVAADEVEGSGAPRRMLSFNRAEQLVRAEYIVEGVHLERRIAVPQGMDAVILSYRILEVPPRLRRRPLLLEVTPLLSYRSAGQTDADAGSELDLTPYAIDDKVRFDPRPPLPPLFFTHEADAFQPEPEILDHFPLVTGSPSGAVPETTIGRPGSFLYQVGPERPVYLAAAAREPLEGPARRLEALITGTHHTIRRIPTRIETKGTLTTALLQATHAHIISTGRGRRWITSGYPGGGSAWDEALIALPGLTLSTGLHDVAREMLVAATETLSRGRLPAYQTQAPLAPAPAAEGDAQPVQRATLAATLRLFDVVDSYLRVTGDVRTVRKVLYPSLRDCLGHLLSGSAGATVTDEGLLETEALPTSLDTRPKVATNGGSPTRALAVGLNALWCSALAAIRDLAQEFNDRAVADEATLRWDRASTAFRTQFWNADRGCLYEQISGGVPDPTLRPNQVLAHGLRYPLLEPEQAASMVAVVERELLTPRGLRSLAPGEPGYAGRENLLYAWYPDLGQRGSAYPWYLGPFARAYLRVHNYSSQAKTYIAALLAEFVGALREGAVGQIAKRYDGDPPHSPRGRPAAAVSVAELLRVCLEELGGEV